MSKKSGSRIQADIAKGAIKLTPQQKQRAQQETVEVRIWDEVEMLRTRANEAMTAPAYVLPLIRSQELLVEIKKQGSLDQFVNAAKVLGKDCKEFREQMAVIGEKHAGKAGNCTEEELLDGLAIGEEYIALIQSFNTVVLPTIQQITEIAEIAGSQHVLSQADDVVSEQQPVEVVE